MLNAETLNNGQTKERPLKLGIILFPDFDQLDVTGPLEVFSNFPNTKVYFISNNLDTVKSSVDIIRIKPNATFSTAPQLDVLFVPGGKGVTKAIAADNGLIPFIKKQTPELKYLSSVCTGALILGNAGELKGYKATTHWMSKKYLPSFSAIAIDQRVVVDRNRVTGAGVTSGFDVALQLGALLFGKTFVEKQELLAEYFNHPVLYNTTPESASPEAKEDLEKEMAALTKSRDDFFK
jgi:cyclohexyl-isocyanide hydratase